MKSHAKTRGKGRKYRVLRKRILLHTLHEHFHIYIRHTSRKETDRERPQQTEHVSVQKVVILHDTIQSLALDYKIAISQIT